MKQDEGLAMLTRAIEAARRIDPQAASWLADGLHLVRVGSAKSLDLALGIRARGIASLATRERLAVRDRHVRCAFTLIEFNEGTTTASRIRELASEVSLFAASTWQWSRRHAQPPARLTPLQVELWHAHRCGSVPTSEPQLKRIVAAADHERGPFDD